MIDHRHELVQLRVSMARLAQAAGVSLAAVGVPDDAPYQMLLDCARTVNRGWNELAATVTDQMRMLRGLV